jgi:hypothetical protein
MAEMRTPRRRIGYAEAMSTLAVFIALGGGAWALARDSVDERAIENGTVRSQELKDDDVRGVDIEANAVVGADVRTGSLDPEDINPAGNGLALPLRGGLLAQVRDVGTGGDVLFGGISGRTDADADMDEVQMHTPNGTGEFGRMFVRVESTLAAGETRTFTLVRRAAPGGQIFDLAVSCTVAAGQQFCTSDQVVQVNTQLVAVKVESSGAGLNAGDDAYIGIEYGVRT